MIFQLDNFDLGQILDDFLGQQLRLSLCDSLPSLQRVLVLLQGPNHNEISALLRHCRSRSDFWNNVTNVWFRGFAGELAVSITPEVSKLFLSADISLLHQFLISSREDEEMKEQFMSFLKDLKQIQEEKPLPAKDWKALLARCPINSSVRYLHVLCLEKVVLRWLKHSEPPNGKPTLAEQIATHVSTLFTNCNWRYTEVSNLFRFQMDTYDQKKVLIGILSIIYEYGLEDSIIRTLPSILKMEHLKHFVEKANLHVSLNFRESN